MLFWALAVSLGINGVLFLLAFWRQSDKLTDASYALSFISVTLFGLSRGHGSAFNILAAMLVCIWAVRIGSFLLYRVLKTGKDGRFDDMRSHFWRFGKFWLGQAITVWVLTLPVLLVFDRRANWHNTALLGLLIWLIGVNTEAVADFQKYRFTHTPANKGQWIDVGIWRYSRHPNYFGEILVWIGIYLYAFPALNSTARWIGIISPLVITTLLLFVSGIPILEKSADKKWGSDPKYQQYKQRTSVLIPLPNKK